MNYSISPKYLQAYIMEESRWSFERHPWNWWERQ